MKNSLYKISIPEPCHEDWNTMTPNAKDRFCSSCAKTVVDFTHLSKEEIMSHLSSHKNVCGRLNSNQLNTIYQLPYKERFKLARFAAACLLVFGLGLFNYSCEMESPQVNLLELTSKGTSIFTNSDPETLGELALVKDSNTVQQLEKDSVQEVEQNWNKTNTYDELEGIEGEIALEMIPEECINSEKHEDVGDTIYTLTKEDIEQIPLDYYPMIGAVVLVERPEKTIEPIVVPENELKLFPNPANHVTNLRFKPRKLESKDDITFQIFNQTGALVQQERMTFEGEDFTAKFAVSDLTNGAYFVNFVYGEERFSEKLIVQH
ncbi:Por secretion system C-terminal sorting domain-containing protein [Lishizhenia tianjinensis]|uniref:Por secretion system C-terminal sorting domain-containing protein n=1 Tax=Lishizhenia tianjinensis TaxID=477690 RepID=A0A1I7ALC4_9FLAO|nr:T9SS type A sorting domain-containing protein [Lishizhenia tianjinensis]SFT75674.1 Por secretion system C-terminal sorting domain-containing protein [Lishizhenia tianjinensis]